MTNTNKVEGLFRNSKGINSILFFFFFFNWVNKNGKELAAQKMQSRISGLRNKRG